MEVDPALPAERGGASSGGVDHTRRFKTAAILSVILAGAGAVGSLLALAMVSAGCPDPERSTSCTRVLFIGNSYTTVNDLPSVFANLARSGGHRVETGTAAVDGWSLADHAASSVTATTLASKNWDIVVLQEQSQIPSVEQFRQDQMYPAARRLIGSIRNTGARPLFYLTWGPREGWAENAMPDYANMQAAIGEGYPGIAPAQPGAVAAVREGLAALLHPRTQRPPVGPGAELERRRRRRAAARLVRAEPVLSGEDHGESPARRRRSTEAGGWHAERDEA